MNSFYHHQSLLGMLSGNYWTLVAFGFIVTVFFIGMRQYRISYSDRGLVIVRHYTEVPYLVLGLLSFLVITVLLVVESTAGIIQLMDNLMRFNETPMMSVILVPFIAVFFGLAFGFFIALFGYFVGRMHRTSLVKQIKRYIAYTKLQSERRTSCSSRPSYPARNIRRQNPKGQPRPGAAKPIRYRCH